MDAAISYMAIPGLISLMTPDQIKNLVETYTCVQIDDNTRKREVVEARQIAMYAIKVQSSLSLSQIGLICGDKDHATVLHGIKTVANLWETSPVYRRKYNGLFSALKLQI